MDNISEATLYDLVITNDQLMAENKSLLDKLEALTLNDDGRTKQLEAENERMKAEQHAQSQELNELRAEIGKLMRLLRQLHTQGGSDKRIWPMRTNGKRGE